MKPDDFLRKLDQELGHLPEQEKQDWLEEIRSHLEEGQQDPTLVGSPDAREARLDHEMGEPAELARQLKRVHRSLAWVEYLIIVLPNLLLSTIIALAFLIFFQPDWLTTPAADALGYRLSIVVYICLAYLAMRLYRRQGLTAALLYVLSAICLKVIGLYLRGNYFKGTFLSGASTLVDALLWMLVFLVVFIWLTRVLRKSNDVLWYVFTATFFLTAAVNYLNVNAQVSGLLPDLYRMNDPRIGWFGISQIGLVLWPAILVFSKQRIWRWFAIFLSLAPAAWLNIASTRAQPAIMAINLIPILVVAIFWMLDLRERRHLTPLARE